MKHTEKFKVSLFLELISYNWTKEHSYPYLKKLPCFGQNDIAENILSTKLDKLPMNTTLILAV